MAPGTVIIAIGLLAFAGPASAFTEEECLNTIPSTTCYQTLQSDLFFALDYSSVCQGMANYISCLEAAACDCNDTANYDVATSITYYTHYYSNQACDFFIGPLPDTKGIPCDISGGGSPGAEGELIQLSISVSQYVVALQGKCNGYQVCYAVYDTDAALALHDRNLTQLCTELDALVFCLETAACGCDTNDTDLIENIRGEDQYFRQMCDQVQEGLIARNEIKCDEDGNGVRRTVCDLETPSNKCYNDYNDQITLYGESLEIYCPALKTYVECIEGVACQCGLVRDTTMYNLITYAIHQYNLTECHTVSGDIEVIPGIQCADGSGTGPGETSVVQRIAEDPSVLEFDQWCGGIKTCYEDMDKRDGVALFEKSQQKMCQSSKLFVECMEVASCQCGVYNYDNITIYLNRFRNDHDTDCYTFPDTSLGDNYQCSNITLNDCVNYDLIGQCSTTLQDQFGRVLSHMDLCRAVKDYVDCQEHIGCECNLTQSFEVASSITYIHHYYELQECPSTPLGDLPATKGIPCEKWGGDASSLDGELIVLSLSVAPFVVSLEQKCAGFQECYRIYDTDAAMALHYRNLTNLCSVLHELVMCVETAACGCDGDKDQEVINMVLVEDEYYRTMCQSTTNEEMIARDGVLCNDDGSSVIRTFCHKPDPIYKCVSDLDFTLLLYGEENDVQCPAMRTYIECVEKLACDCGLLRDYRVYKALTNATVRYDKLGCAAESGSLTITPGIRCPDGTGTLGQEQSIILQLAEQPSVAMMERSCKGVKKCYSDQDTANGVAYFQKDTRKVCRNSKNFVECLEVTFCQCGQYEEDNATRVIEEIRTAHLDTCVTDAVLRDDFVCKQGAPGIKCLDHQDCGTVTNTECKYYGECDCIEGYVFKPETVSCSAVSGATSHDARAGLPGLVLMFILYTLFQ